jgi:hypothetical protein
MVERAGLRRPDTASVVALEELVAEHYDRLLRVAVLICHDRTDAEDAVQVALERAWRHGQSLRDPDRFPAWLHRIVVRESIRLEHRKRGLISRWLSSPREIAVGLPPEGDRDLDLRRRSAISRRSSARPWSSTTSRAIRWRRRRSCRACRSKRPDPGFVSRAVASGRPWETPMDGVDVTNGERHDAQIRAFLERESSRRAGQRPRDADVVAAIRNRRGRRWPMWARAVAAVVIVLVGLSVVASVLMLRSSTGVASSPSAPTVAPGLGFPTVAAGEPCPVSQPMAAGNGSATLLGNGPVRLMLASASGDVFFEATAGGDWKSIDLLWTAAPGFADQVRVRGARLDASDELRFGDPSDPLSELQIAAAGGQTPIVNGRSVVSTTPMRLKAPGCYGLRIDSGAASSVVVFEAKPIEDAFPQLERPLQLPGVVSESCPVSPTTNSVPFLSVALGEGPVYIGSGVAEGSFSAADKAGGFALMKEIWIAGPEEPGPILVRGGRIDTTGDLRFGDGSEPATALRLAIHSYEHTSDQPLGWRIFVSYVRPPSAGCYAMQVDTLTGSRWIVFDVAQ